MPHRVRVEPSGHEFTVAGGDTLLEAALRAGLSFDYGCSNGNCGQCRVRLVSGEVRTVHHHDFTFGEAERLAGAVLACSVEPVGDLVVEAGEAVAPGEIEEQHIRAQYVACERHGDRVAVMTLRTPRSQRLRFLAGQHVRIGGGDEARLLPIASCPCESGRLRFHVVAEPGSPFPDALFSGRLKRFSSIDVRGPYGEFVIAPEDESRPLLFVAIGSGFAPVQGLIEQALALDETRPIDLVRVPTPVTGRYLDNLCRAWHDALDPFEYRLVDGLPALLDGWLARELPALRERCRAARTYVAGPKAAATPVATALRGALGPEHPLRIATEGIAA